MSTLTNFKTPALKLAAVTSIILSVPLIAMQFSTEVAWTLSDFLIAGIFMFGTGISYLFIREQSDHNLYRIATGLGLGAGLFMLWANGAVGLIGSENEPANLMYLAVIGVGLIGAAVSRLKPQGLSYTFFAMAATVAVIIVFALITGMQDLYGSSVTEILAVNGFFIVLFTLPAILYRHVYQDAKDE